MTGLSTAEKLEQLRCASQRDVILNAVAEMRAGEATIVRQAARIEALEAAFRKIMAIDGAWYANDLAVLDDIYEIIEGVLEDGAAA